MQMRKHRSALRSGAFCVKIFRWRKRKVISGNLIDTVAENLICLLYAKDVVMIRKGGEEIKKSFANTGFFYTDKLEGRKRKIASTLIFLGSCLVV